MTVICNLGTKFNFAFDNVPYIINIISRYKKDSWIVTIHLDGTYLGITYSYLCPYTIDFSKIQTISLSFNHIFSLPMYLGVNLTH